MAIIAMGIYISCAMTTHEPEVSRTLRLGELRPYLTVILLEATADDPERAFDALQRFLRKSARDRGRADEVRVRAEVSLTGTDLVDDLGTVRELGFDELYGSVRELKRSPTWTDPDSGYVDVINELSLAVRRNNMVAVCAAFPTENGFGRWIHRSAAPFRFVPPNLLAGAFRGDGRRLWLRGVHRRRTTKADSKALGGLRLQDSLTPIEDGTYAMTAAKLTYVPDDERAVLRDLVTISPGSSKISWKRTPHIAMFLAAVGEALDVIEKALVADEDPVSEFPALAVQETDLSRVWGAYEVLVPDPDEVRGEPDGDEESVERAEYLRSVVIDVRGEPSSGRALVDVGHDGAVAGTLAVKPVATTSGVVRLDVRYHGEPSAEAVTREVKEAIGDGDLISVYYESGHHFNGHQVVKERLVSTPFRNVEFEDFCGYSITKEKPAVRGDQLIHDAIAQEGDNSLFAWVVRSFGGDWLLCDDGAGELADFLHLTDKGTLTAIHVKAARSSSPDRRIAVQPFEQVVTQAEKNVRLLDNDVLLTRLATPRIENPAAWHAGQRITCAQFVQQLRLRVAADRTNVLIIQPHLRREPYLRARDDAASGKTTRDTNSLALLDNVLHTTRRTVIGLWDELSVIGCR
ncbi:hypothetical protein [Amycolatopsis suaedae]|uniref:Uncharacterized protein n=1 Tax=Amycolatopsis suaedae TaxID=2510978 RepID=A0A4V2EME9_9PSEU|nr:hypothetical protein [Amycolatopsis suaedae]RZQ64825.1 hypothetical protein EWH70_08045 [Amycolatopsis suaedae]